MDVDEAIRSGIAQLKLIQRSQQKLFYNVDELDSERLASVARDLLLGLHEETNELARIVHKALQFHIVNQSLPDKQAISNECADILKYVLCIIDLYDIDERLLVKSFFDKTAVVYDRFNAREKHLADENVLLVDLDGCLADLEGGFRKWLAENEKLWVDNLDDDASTVDINHPRFNLPKDYFQGGGGLSNLDVLYPDSISTLNVLQAKVVIVTARPYPRFKNVYGDTIEWLKKIGLTYHHIIFSADKTEAIERVRPAKIIGLVEDYYKYAMPCALAGIKVFKLPSSSDHFYSFKHENLIIVNDWHDIRAELEKQ